LREIATSQDIWDYRSIFEDVGMFDSSMAHGIQHIRS
jgi:hypothetical protein